MIFAKFAAKITLNPLDRKIRIGAVSYLNTKPLLYGIQHSPLREQTELVLGYPAKIAQQLIDNKIDIGLVPVAILPRLKEKHIVSDFCIGCNGPVASVAVFADEPLEQLKAILLDYQSKTSAALTKLMIKHYWKLHPDFSDTKGEGYLHRLTGNTGGLVIGDRALEQRLISTFHYDLGEAWHNFSGLPFVFAAWVSNKPIDPAFTQAFNEANHYGLNHIEEVIKENPYSTFDLRTYYKDHISYQLDKEKRKGMDLFLSMLQKEEVVHPLAI